MRDEKYNRIPIVRQSMPFGDVNKNGLLFIAYSSDVSKFDVMLDRMTGNTSDGKNDSIMKYSSCVSGNYWYFPSLEELNSF
jgi:porphyrinogen peroxidase